MSLMKINVSDAPAKPKAPEIEPGTVVCFKENGQSNQYLGICGKNEVVIIAQRDSSSILNAERSWFAYTSWIHKKSLETIYTLEAIVEDITINIQLP